MNGKLLVTLLLFPVGSNRNLSKDDLWSFAYQLKGAKNISNLKTHMSSYSSDSYRGEDESGD
jgi:hypothetical protein